MNTDKEMPISFSVWKRRARKPKVACANFIPVDVRGPSSFAKGHVQGAIHIPQGKMTA